MISADLKSYDLRCILNKRLRNDSNTVVTSQLNRRQFVQNTAMAGAGFWSHLSNVWGHEVGPDENQKREWIRAIQGGSAPLSNFDYASVLTEAMLLGNVTIRTGKPLEYDGETGTVTNHPNAASLINPPARKGWKL